MFLGQAIYVLGPLRLSEWVISLRFGAEGGGSVLGELGAGGGVNGLCGREAFEGPERVEGLDKFSLDRRDPGE
jgi:hypothetical protein